MVDTALRGDKGEGDDAEVWGMGKGAMDKGDMGIGMRMGVGGIPRMGKGMDALMGSRGTRATAGAAVGEVALA